MWRRLRREVGCGGGLGAYLKGKAGPRRAGSGLTRRDDHGGDPAGSSREVDGGGG